jgi:signal transduction histidine kinase
VADVLPSRRSPVPGLARSRDNRVWAGVAGGVAEWLGVDAVIIRLAFVLLTLVSGVGAIVYVVGAVVLPEGDVVPRGARRADDDGRAVQTAVAVALITLGALLFLRSLGLWFSDRVMWPATLTAGGIAVVWSRTGAPSFTAGRMAVFRLVVGGLLLVAGLGAFFATSDSFAAVRQVLLAMAITVAGLGLVIGPWVWRMARDLGEERRERIRSEERAEMAAHLHDSVLQTLALIQRNADQPKETVALARRQERELRAWLYGQRERTGTTLAAAVDAVASEVETMCNVTVDEVTVGDCPLDDRVDALVLAAREAMMNAAKHAGVDTVSLYVEVEDDRVVAFVRDRGKGFDPSTVASDRKGIAESIVARMARHGGSATITSEPGDGTEVALEVGRRG